MTASLATALLLLLHLRASAASPRPQEGAGENRCLAAQRNADDPNAACAALKQSVEDLGERTLPDWCARVMVRLKRRGWAAGCWPSPPALPPGSTPTRHSGCPEFESARSALKKDGASADRRRELLHSARKCLEGNPPHKLESAAAYELLKAELDECLVEEGCRDLRALRTELARATTAYLRVLEPYSGKSLEVQQELIALGATDDLIAVLNERGLDAQQVRKLIRIALINGSDSSAHAALVEIAERLAALAGSTSTSDILAIFDQVTRLYQRNQFDPWRLRLRLSIAEMIADDASRKKLATKIRKISTSAETHERAAAVAEALEKGGVDLPEVVAGFLEVLSPLILQQIGFDAGLARLYSVSEHGWALGSSPVLFMRGPGPSDQDKASQEGRSRESRVERVSSARAVCEKQLLRRFSKLIHFNYGPQSGVSPPVDVTAQVEDSSERIEALLSAQRGDRSFSEIKESWPCTSDKDLCRWPMAGAYLFRFDEGGGGRLAVTGQWWVLSSTPSGPSSNAIDRGTLPASSGPVEFIPCDDASTGEAALALARQAIADVPSLKSPPILPPPPPPPLRTGSAWTAALFAGAPFLVDERASSASRIISSSLDGVLLASAGVSAGLALHHRNEFAHGREGTLEPANRAAAVALGSATALLVTRLASGLIARHWPSLWEKSR